MTAKGTAVTFAKHVKSKGDKVGVFKGDATQGKVFHTSASNLQHRGSIKAAIWTWSQFSPARQNYQVEKLLDIFNELAEEKHVVSPGRGGRAWDRSPRECESCRSGPTRPNPVAACAGVCGAARRVLAWTVHAQHLLQSV
jgi:hypothetical protein